MPTDYLVVLITVPNPDIGEMLAQNLLANRLAACVNILPGMRSLFHWAGEIQAETEALLMVKTRAELFAERLVPAIKAAHPYEVPEIIALPVILGAQDYLDWIAAETSAVENQHSD